MLEGKKSKDLLRATMTGLGVGLLCYTDFQISARIPLPTPSATLPPGEGIFPDAAGLGGTARRPFPTDSIERFRMIVGAIQESPAGP